MRFYDKNSIFIFFRNNMSTVVTNTTVFTNREFPFKEISLSESLEKRNRKYYVDYHIQDQPIFFQINKVLLASEPIFIDDEQGYIDVEIKDRLVEIQKYFDELDNFNQVSCFQHSEEWLGKNLSMAEIEGVYKSSFKNNQLRLKIENENIRIFDLKRNKLSLEKDIKIGNVLDIIIEISGLKVMKNAFATHLVLRQIRKHPEPVPLRQKKIPSEYLFIDDYSKMVQKDDFSIDDQTDVDVLVSLRKKNSSKPPVLKEDNSEVQSEVQKTIKKEEESFNIEKEDENTNDYLQSVEKLKTMMSTILDEESVSVSASFHGKEEDPEHKVSKAKEDETSSKATKETKENDNVLKQLENGDITLGSAISEQSEKMPKKIVGGRKSATGGDLRGKSATGDARRANRTEGGKKVSVKKAVAQELYKNL
jgi:hypothetical protein